MWFEGLFECQCSRLMMSCSLPFFLLFNGQGSNDAISKTSKDCTSFWIHLKNKLKVMSRVFINELKNKTIKSIYRSAWLHELTHFPQCLYQGPISWHCIPQNSALTEPCKAHANLWVPERKMNLGPVELKLSILVSISWLACNMN